MAKAVHEHVDNFNERRDVYFTGKVNLREIDRRDFYSLFEQYGDIRKLFISQDGTFGNVLFGSRSAARQALKLIHNAPPFYLNLSFSDPRKDGRIKAPNLNGSVSSDMDDFIEAGKTVKYDVYGNPVDIFEDDNGECYVPYHQMAKAGYKLYSKDESKKQLKSNDRLIKEFNLYMLSKAKKFMRENEVSLNEITIEETIDCCRKKIFSNTEASNNQIDTNNIKFVVKQNNTEQFPRKLRHPKTHQSPNSSNASQHNTSMIETEVKKLTPVKLKENCVNKVLVTHVEGKDSCYVTPFENVEERNRVMTDVGKCISTGKKAEIHKNLIYACSYGQMWYRAKILRKDREIEAFLIDDGRKVIINSASTLPKQLIDIPAQAVLIKIQNAGVALEKGITLEVNPVQTLDNGYIVQAKPQNERKAPGSPPKYVVVDTKKPRADPSPKPLTKPHESSKNHVTSPKKPTPSTNSARKIIIPPRECLIDKVPSAGMICCSEIIDSKTFVAYLIGEDYYNEMTMLEEIENDCFPDKDYKPEIGHVVAVEKKDEDGVKWVRGVVCAINNKTYECALIDYGVKQLCQEVRKLPEKYIKVPNFSCICETDADTIQKIVEAGDGALYKVNETGKIEIKAGNKTYDVKAKIWNPINVIESETVSVEKEPKPKTVDSAPKPYVSEKQQPPVRSPQKPQKSNKIQTQASKKPTAEEKPAEQQKSPVRTSQNPPEPKKTQPQGSKTPTTEGKTEISTRKCVIDKLPSTGTIFCSELVDSESIVAYLVSADFEDEILLLEEIGNDCISGGKCTPQLGDLVAVEKKDEADKWVRGLVYKIKEKEYKCALVDYGVSQSSQTVRKLPEKYIDIPNFTCICRANPDIIKRLAELKEEVEYTIEKPGILKITIEDETITVMAECWNPVKVSKKQKIYKPLPSYTLNDGDFLKLKSVDEDNAVLLCETKRCFVEIKEIEAHIKTITPQLLTNPPEVDQLVLSPWGDEEGLFRGIVRSHNNAEAEIYFMDYGNCDTIPIDKLRNVDDKLASYGPALVQSPKFWYLESRKLSEDSYTFLAENGLKKYKAVNCNSKFDLVATDGKLLSQILESYDNKKAKQSEAKPKSLNTSANSSFSNFKEELTLHNSSSSASIINVKSEPAETQTSTFSIKDLPLVNLPPGKYQCVCVLSTDLEHGLVTFILAQDDNVDLMDVQDKIEKYVETEKTPFDPKDQDLCIALYEGCWYRGAVVGKDDDGSHIYFVDFGNTELVKTENIRSIFEELVKVPALAMICQLDGIENITEEVLKGLQTHIIQDELYEVEVVGKSEDDAHLIRIPEVYEKMKGLL